MSIPAAPPLLTATQDFAFIKPSAGTTAVADKASLTTPLDFLLITSRVDFSHFCQKFIEECSRAGVYAEILFIEDLPGQTPGEKLTSLHRTNADWHANGKVAASTIKVELLHGRVGNAPTDASLDRFRQECIGMENPKLQSGQGSDAAASAPSEVHIMGTANCDLAFPTDLFNAALRATTMTDSQTSAGFAGTIINGSCGAGVFRDTAKKSTGSYVIASGKKSVFTADFNAGLHALIRDQGERKRLGSTPLSARDCWNLLRDHSGEHVALVGNDTVEINKVLQFGHSEPAIKVGSDTGAQAIRTLFAKIDHGSAAAVAKVIERWGPSILSADHDAVIPSMPLFLTALESRREPEQKTLLLIKHATNYLNDRVVRETWLNKAISNTWISALVELFKRMATITPPPMSPEAVVIWMKSNPEQTETLLKRCRSSRALSESVGDYLYKAQLAEPNQDYLERANFVLPPFFVGLAKKAAERAMRQATQ